MCSPSVHLQEPPSFLFCDSSLLFRPHLSLIHAQAAPFSLQMWVSINCTCHHTPRSPSYSQELPSKTASIHRSDTTWDRCPDCHIPASAYNKRPRIFRYGVFFKKKPAMTYSPTPSKVQYHRREESELLGSEWSQAFPSCYNHRKVEARGLEPLTLCLQSRCATNCATPPH